MDDEGKIPKLLVFLFGEAAATAQRGASGRLRGWCVAFDEWLDDRKQNYKPGAFKAAAQAWRRLLGEQGKMPWELRQEDFEQHAARMAGAGVREDDDRERAGGRWRAFTGGATSGRWTRSAGRASTRRRGRTGRKSNAMRGRSCSAGRRWRSCWGILRRDGSALGKRDYAFFLMRLRMGAPLRNLQQLRWGQIEGDASIGDARTGDASTGDAIALKKAGRGCAGERGEGGCNWSGRCGRRYESG